MPTTPLATAARQVLKVAARWQWWERPSVDNTHPQVETQPCSTTPLLQRTLASPVHTHALNSRLAGPPLTGVGIDPIRLGSQHVGERVERLAPGAQRGIRCQQRVERHNGGCQACVASKEGCRGLGIGAQKEGAALAQVSHTVTSSGWVNAGPWPPFLAHQWPACRQTRRGPGGGGAKQAQRR